MIAFSVSGLPAQGQNRKTFTIKPGERVLTAIPREEVYTFADFVPGKVYFKNDQYAPSRLNYNALIGEIQFIDPKGDTLSLANEETIKLVVLQTDTFYFDGGYLHHLGEVGPSKLARREEFEVVNKQKLGGFGEASSAGIETYNHLTYRSFFKDLVAQEVLTMAKKSTLYIGDRFNHFKEVNPKTVKEAFPNKQKEIKAYLKENKVNFSSEEAVKKLLVTMNGE